MPIEYVETIDASFNYMKWHYITKEITLNIQLLVQDASFIEEETLLIAAFSDQKCICGTTAGLIRGFCLKTMREIFKMNTFNSIFQLFVH